MKVPPAIVLRLLSLLFSIRYSGYPYCRLCLDQFAGYVEALSDVGVISFEAERRLRALSVNAISKPRSTGVRK